MPEPIQFVRFELRTTDLAAARSFYTELFGGRCPGVVLLPEQAAARGARPHWLGHLGVDDVERAVSRFVERGATRLGPTRSTAGGGDVAIVRDPGGAVLALAAAAPEPAGVIWHGLHTLDLARTTAAYCDLFGWHLTDRLDLGELGVFHEFAWRPGGASVGAISDVTARPGVHAHWLFHFRVPALAPALDLVRAAGGLVVGPFMLPGGERIAVCEDPQGAAFALHERRGSA